MGDSLDLQDVAVLAVDDIEDNLDLIEEYLEDEVWSVLRASGGEEAVRLAKEHRPDVVLLDLMMPMMNGLAILRSIRSSDGLQDVGVILQTAYTDRDNVVTAQRLGCKHILRKPLQKDRLLAEIRACLRGQPSRRKHARPTAEADATPRPHDFATALLAARERIESRRLVGALDDPDTMAYLRALVASDSDVGRRLIRVANSPFYAGRQPARSVAQALVRIGTQMAGELLRKASRSTRHGLTLEQTLRVLELLEIVTSVVPEHAAGPDELDALLEQLRRQLDAERGADSAARGPTAGGARMAEPAQRETV